MVQNIYRVHLIPSGGEFTSDPWCIFDLCVQRSIIGVGWAVDNYVLGPTSDFEAYRAAYEIGGKSVDGSVVTLARMRKGDLAWIRDPGRTYYLAEVRGPWRYCDSPLHRAFDVMNVRDVKIWRVPADRIPQHIRNHGFPQTVQRIANDAAIAETIDLWNGYYDGEAITDVR